LHRTLLAARAKREQRGSSGDGKVVVLDLRPEEALALDGLLAPRKPILPKGRLQIALSQFEAALRSCGIEPHAAYEQVGDGPLRDLPAERRARRELRAGFDQWLRSHHALRCKPAIAEWFECALRQGRVRPEMRSLVDQALQIVAILPAAKQIQRTELAARMLDDPHALDVDRPLHGLLVSLLLAGATLDAEASVREIWSAWNVLLDPISSNVTVLNLPLSGDKRIVGNIRSMWGTHLVLTYGQLTAGELRWPAGVTCFSCENPSVLIAAERELGERCPPLLCTAGRPSDAVRTLLSLISDADGQIRHHGDFDQAGVQILRDLEARYAAVPWRFDVASLDGALATLGRAQLHPRPTTLDRAVEQLRKPLPEELLIDNLVSDLRCATDHQ
jgi:uncharacterized protein (TIGR02679 family)